MRTFVEVRVTESWANKEYGSSLGEPLSDLGQPAFVRKIVLEIGDPRLADLKARLERDHDKPAVLVERQYTATELANAELFRLHIVDGLEDACGEDFGTEYDDSTACSRCGAGRAQLSPLRLDLSLVPVGLDIGNTIALAEWIVSQRLVDLIEANEITGYRAQEVEHVGNKKPKGRWYQLVVTGNAGQTIDPTHFGLNYFEDDIQGTYTCPEHLLSGLHILSEAFVSRKDIENVDLALTSNRTGRRSGVLMPTPLILISPRFYQLVKQNQINGCKVEIAHVVD